MTEVLYLAFHTHDRRFVFSGIMVNVGYVNEPRILEVNMVNHEFRVSVGMVNLPPLKVNFIKVGLPEHPAFLGIFALASCFFTNFL